MILNINLIMYKHIYVCLNNAYCIPINHFLRGYKHFQVRRKNSSIKFYAIWNIFKTQLSVK